MKTGTHVCSARAAGALCTGQRLIHMQPSPCTRTTMTDRHPFYELAKKTQYLFRQSGLDGTILSLYQTVSDQYGDGSFNHTWRLSPDIAGV
jgi:hypothetical protein